MKLLEELTSYPNKGHQTDVLVMDLTKAFDRENHILLCHKLDHYGIRKQANSWISGFLHGRRWALAVDGAKFDIIPERSGVPQGSVLYPCLFLVYFNNLSDRVMSLIHLFANDTILYRLIIPRDDYNSILSSAACCLLSKVNHLSHVLTVSTVITTRKCCQPNTLV